MTPEEEAAELILTLESVIEDLRAIENGKNYTREEAAEQMRGIRMALGAEA